MKKESKNLGVTKACPECKKTLIRSANFTGEGTFNLKCPYCNTIFMVQVKNKPALILFKIGLVFIILFEALALISITHSANMANYAEQ